MLKDKILEEIFSNKEMQKIPIGTQATAVSVFEKVLEDLKEVDPDASISELFANE